VPERESYGRGDIFIDTGEHGKVGLFYPLEDGYPVRIDEVQGNRETKEIWPDIEHRISIQN
jgi:hypothetical protein